MKIKNLVLIIAVSFSLTGCAMLKGMYGDISEMTPTDYAENAAIVRKATNSLPFPWSEAATLIGTWGLFLVRNKYKEIMRKKATELK